MIIIRHPLPTDFPYLVVLGDKLFGSGCFTGWTPQMCLVAAHPDPIGMIDFHETAWGIFLDKFIVEPSYQRSGVGSALYHEAIKLLPPRKMYATCWKESPHPGIIPFLEQMGWTIASEIPNYWYQESIDNGYSCARCGNPCLCTAVVTIKDLTDC
jgi:GNAT superfamily N-acetyltransferase